MSTVTAATSSESDTLLSAALASASSLVLLQLFSRSITFVLNQALVRMASPQTFGTAAIQFELLLSTILFLCREGVRNALLRAKSSSNAGQETADASTESALERLTTNISLIPVLLGIPIAILATVLYIYLSTPSTTSQPHFHLSVMLYALAAFLELLSEPLYIRAQNQFRFDVRVRAEGAAVVTRTVVTFVILVFTPPEWALVAFSVGQAAYGLTTFVSFFRVYGRNFPFFFRKVSVSSHGNTKSAYFDKDLLHLSGAMTAQSIVKHFLTEGDKFLVSQFSPLADQGGYALAANYGSLVARIIFQPIEETSRVFFSKTLSSSSKNPKGALRTTSQILMSLLLLFTHLFLFLTTFGPPYLSLAVSILLPPRYHNTSAPLILQTYIYYIPTMAFNGLLEAFLASTSTPSDLRSQSRWMLFFSFMFILCAVGFSRGFGWGDPGLVWANVANLGARALYAWSFTRRFFKQRGVKEMVNMRKAIPPLPVSAVFALAAGLTRWSARLYQDLPISSQLGHMALGLGCLAGCLAVCFIFEHKTFREILVIIRPNK